MPAPVPAQPAIDLAWTCVQERLVDDAAPDGGLVGDDDRREAGALEQAECVGGPRKQRQLLEAIEVAALLDDRAVAIEKDCRSLMTRDCRDLADSGFVIRSVTARITRSGESPFMQR